MPKKAFFSRCMHVGLVDLLTKNGTPGTNSLLLLFFILFFLYFLAMPGGASEGAAGPPTARAWERHCNASH